MAWRRSWVVGACLVALTALVGCSAPAVTDTCGNDISGVGSTVIAFDGATGGVRWRRDDLGPAWFGATFQVIDGDLRFLPESDRGSEILLDPSTGATVETRTRGTVVVDGWPTLAPVPRYGSMVTALYEQPVADEQRAYAVVQGRLVATDLATGAQVWEQPVPRDGSSSFPLLVGGLVIIGAADVMPPCSTA